jgi:hypothetical protein
MTWCLPQMSQEAMDENLAGTEQAPDPTRITGHGVCRREDGQIARCRLVRTKWILESNRLADRGRCDRRTSCARSALSRTR